MTSSIFSFMIAVLWCDIFVIAVHFLMKRNKFIIHITIYSVLCVMIISLLRLFLGFEFGTAIVIRSYKIFPAIINFLNYAPFQRFSDAYTIRIIDMCIILWIAGSVIYVLRILIGLIRFKICMIGEKEADDENLYLIVDEITGGKADKMRIICTTKVNVPLISGLIRPAIYLPDIEFSEPELYYTLSHEWMHYVHKDLWVKFLLDIVCAIYWWNPVIYIFKYNIDTTLEIKSDLNLSKNMNEDEKIEYLESIMKIMRKVKGDAPTYTYNDIKLEFFTARMNDNQIKQRFNYMIESGKLKGTKKSTLVVFYTVMVVMVVISYMFIIQSAGVPKEYKEEIYEYDLDTAFDIDPDNSYLVKEPDGTYSLYIDEKKVGVIENPKIDELSSLKIYKREDLE